MTDTKALSSEQLCDLGENAVNDLMHHGVKGQKWGVRKAGTSGSSHSLSLSNLSEAQKASLKTIGKSALRAGLITGGSVAVAAFAGPQAGALTASIGSAMSRAFSTSSTTRDSSFSNGPTISVEPNGKMFDLHTPNGVARVNSTVEANHQIINQFLSGH